MSAPLPEDQWLPVGVDELEPNADTVVRSASNKLVVAGPGAGKTELLAQRANFLLETERCPAPKRILAISFKRDASKNLQTRVRERCGENARRFDSLTLDGFAKSLVDRFLPALPAEWRPPAWYQVRLASPFVDDARRWLARAPIPSGCRRPDVEELPREKIRRAFDMVMFGAELPYDAPDVHALLGAWGRHWWQEQLRCPEGQPSLTFPMLSRLAAYLLRCNPRILAALRHTYSYVFLDEFQDTTESQWDLVKSAFVDSTSVLSAVGDRKQRIMVWAGAKLDVFERFEEEFEADRVTLVRNYRSVPGLVRMQHVIARAVEADSTESVPASARGGVGACTILEFRDPEQEAAHLARLIHSEIASGTAEPRDFAILVRQRAEEMVSQLAAELRARGIVMRNESSLQDLRAEPVTDVVLRAIRLATRDRDADAWAGLFDALAGLSCLDRESDGAQVERLVVAHRDCASADVAAGEGMLETPRHIIEMLGANRYRATYRHYANGDLLERTATVLGKALQASLEATGDAAGIADDLAGVNVVPAMTIHKSKGLEFNTVIFLGLEDSEWWAFRDQPDEEKRAFFVAFSRGIRRVLFTYSDQRDTRRGRQRQKRKEVDALYDILRQAGVHAIDMRTELP